MRVSTCSVLALLAFCALIAAGCGGGPKDAAKELAAACERQLDEIDEAKSESKIPSTKSSEAREAEEHTVQCAGQEAAAPAAATTEEPAANDAGTEPKPAAAIDPASRDMFTEKCAGCHTLADAGATGTVGPDLDALTLTADKVTEQIENGGGAMPPALYTGEDAAKVGEYVAAASKASAG